MSDGQSADRAEAGLLSELDADEIKTCCSSWALCPAEGDRDEESTEAF